MAANPAPSAARASELAAERGAVMDPYTTSAESSRVTCSVYMDPLTASPPASFLPLLFAGCRELVL